MRPILKHSIFLLAMMLTSWSCSKASGHGSITMVLSGSVHGQLDPCG